MRTDAHAIGEARSRAYHLRIAARLAADEGVRARALARAEASLRQGLAPAAAAAWIAALAGDDVALQAALCGDDERARWLRSCSPFAGELSPRERWALWRDTKAEVLTAAARARA